MKIFLTIIYGTLIMTFPLTLFFIITGGIWGVITGIAVLLAVPAIGMWLEN